MESSLCKRRRKMVPPLHLDPQDFCLLIYCSPFVHLYRGFLCSEGSYANIFASDFMLQKMKYVEQIHFDGTLYTVPSIFYQSTIFITFHGHCIPALHILMQNTTVYLYTFVVLELHELIPEFSPKLLSVISKKHLDRNVSKHFPLELKYLGVGSILLKSSGKIIQK